MRVLVTGATGFIGGALVRRLIGSGYRVRALARPGADSAALDNAGAEVMTGDLLDPESLSAAVNGMEGLFHTGAIYSYWLRDTSLMYRTNVDGTKSLFAAARSKGVRRAVFTSTVATLKWPGPGRVADESHQASYSELPGHYKRSKLLAEQAVLEFNGPDFEVVVVNPTAPFGPGDARPTPTGRIVLEFLRRSFPGYVSTGMNVCDVDDVAAGHVGAFEMGRAGERYILGSENVTLRGIYELLTKATGIHRRPVRVPYPLAYAAGLLDSIAERTLLRRVPYIPLEGLRVARHPMFVDSGKAVRELGLPQRPAIESLERAARWYIDSGYVHTSRLTKRRTGNMEARE
ncbi:MAG: hopanoid-associated sugar epimerase [Dehalococcoidia bacterium]